MALAAHGCYVGLTFTRVGLASSQEQLAKPISLKWTGEWDTANLELTINARQAEYGLSRPVENVRAGFVIEIVPQTAYVTLADFVNYLEQGRQKQSVDARRVRQQGEELPEPDVIVPRPRARADMVFKTLVEQTIQYSNGDRKLELVEDLLNEYLVSRAINDEPVPGDWLWQSTAFSYKSEMNLEEALGAFGE